MSNKDHSFFHIHTSGLSSSHLTLKVFLEKNLFISAKITPPPNTATTKEFIFFVLAREEKKNNHPCLSPSLFSDRLLFSDLLRNVTFKSFKHKCQYRVSVFSWNTPWGSKSFNNNQWLLTSAHQTHNNNTISNSNPFSFSDSVHFFHVNHLFDL